TRIKGDRTAPPEEPESSRMQHVRDHRQPRRALDRDRSFSGPGHGRLAAVWQMSQRQFQRRPMILIPQERSLSRSNPIIDSSFPSVLVYGTLGSTVWLVSVLVYAPISASGPSCLLRGPGWHVVAACQPFFRPGT